jgi:hypothetical protein
LHLTGGFFLIFFSLFLACILCILFIYRKG